MGKWEKLERHLARFHDGEPPKNKKEKTQCELCGIIIWRSYLARHMKIHHSRNPESRKICRDCNQTFHTISAKEKHDQEVHHGRDLYHCYFCIRTFAKKCFLEVHLKTHTKEGLECGVCKKLLSNGFALKQHMTTVCGVDEDKKAELRRKKRETMAKFRAKKVYGCKKCGARFGQKPMLKYHESKCTGS